MQLPVTEAEKWMLEIVINGSTGIVVDVKIDYVVKLGILVPPSRAA